MTPEPKGKLDAMTMQMGAATKVAAVTAGVANGPEDVADDWLSIDWRVVGEDVRRLRQRIFAASQAGDVKRVRNPQKLMLRSRANTLMSVRRVTEINAGRTTAGVDKQVVLLARDKAELADWMQHRRTALEPTAATGIPVYFADAYCPWQRGSNENSNGLLRQNLPKKTDLSLTSPTRLAAIVDELNRRPRQALGVEDSRRRPTEQPLLR